MHALRTKDKVLDVLALFANTIVVCLHSTHQCRHLSESHLYNALVYCYFAIEFLHFQSNYLPGLFASRIHCPFKIVSVTLVWRDGFCKS